MDDTDLSLPARRRGVSRRAGLVAILAAVVIVLVPGAPAWAHNALAEATPAKGAVLKKAPPGVKLRFLQKLDPDDTTITVTDAGEQAVPTSEPAVDSATGSVTFTEPLVNGEYTVAYRVASRDGHRVQGSYRFTVADPTRTASAAPPPSASPSVTPVDQVVTGTPIAQTAAATPSGASGEMIAGLAAAGIVLVAAVFLLLRRRRASSS
jgi:methionine-rich copper-binding protein CopC